MLLPSYRHRLNNWVDWNANLKNETQNNADDSDNKDSDDDIDWKANLRNANNRWELHHARQNICTMNLNSTLETQPRCQPKSKTLQEHLWMTCANSRGDSELLQRFNWSLVVYLSGAIQNISETAHDFSDAVKWPSQSKVLAWLVDTALKESTSLLVKKGKRRWLLSPESTEESSTSLPSSECLSEESEEYWQFRISDASLTSDSEINSSSPTRSSECRFKAFNLPRALISLSFIYRVYCVSFEARGKNMDGKLAVWRSS